MKTHGAAAVAAIVYVVTGRVFIHQHISTNHSCLAFDIRAPSANSSACGPSNSGPAQGFDEDDQANEEDWERYAHKGGSLMCGLLGTDQAAGRQMNDRRNPPSAASTWIGDLKQEFDTWYWRQVDPATYSCKMNDHWNIPFAMRSLGLNGSPSSEGGDNACFRVEHWDPNKKENGQQVPAINQWYKVDGREYRSTKAHYEFAINIKGGAIFAFFLESPKSSASALWYGGRKDASPDDLPHLRALSDVLWGFWNRENSNVKNIRYFLVLGISNDLTNQLIASCLQKVGKDLSEWPGTTFATVTEEGHALLGSPNGATFAYFLMQHKDQLGYKLITKITVIKPEIDDDLAFVDPVLVFHVEDVPEPPHDEEVKRDTRKEKNMNTKFHKFTDGGWLTRESMNIMK
ncbi:Nn.00g009230.m01.CDS01 [Neocucurbitaria sp. VM-36]